MQLTLPPNSHADRWGSLVRRDRSTRSWCLAAGAAALTHVFLLATLSRIAPPSVPTVAEEAGVPLFLQSLQPLATASLVASAAPAAPLASPAGLTIVAGHAAAPVAVRRHADHAADRAPAARPPQNVAQHGASAAPAAEAVRAGADGTALLPALEARIDDAVRQAARMPEAARRQHRQGRAQIKFTYVDGRVDGVKLVAPSQSRLLDEAALQAVSRAAYPAPPESLRGRELDLLVWVNFRMNA